VGKLKIRCPLCNTLMENNVSKFLMAFQQNTNVIAAMVCPECKCEKIVRNDFDDEDDY